ncbi:MAG: pirin family protein [Thermoplasmata archaeon]|nr:MAG: pirin family protein [Thermoplasmata archaeon]
MSEGVASVARVVKGIHVTDGAGVHLNRIIAQPQLDHMDPFVLLDEFRSDNPDDFMAGFPWHPHRGIETITYVVYGAVEHEDSRGGGGVINDGDVQWMTAGGGILHQEMPKKRDGKVWGYQLWLNLAAKDKMVPARYQALDDDMIPVTEGEAMTVKVIAGAWGGEKGPADTYYPIDYFDVRMGNEGRFAHKVTDEQHKAIYVHTGKLIVDPDGEAKEVEEGNLVILGDGNDIVIEGLDADNGFLFLAGVPHKEPIARGGPFVMNTRDEIHQAFADYQSGKLF